MGHNKHAQVIDSFVDYLISWYLLVNSNYFVKHTIGAIDTVVFTLLVFVSPFWKIAILLMIAYAWFILKISYLDVVITLQTLRVLHGAPLVQARVQSLTVHEFFSFLNGK